MDDGLSGAVGASATAALAAAAAAGAGGHGHDLASSHCLNCGHALQPQDRFCSACGQDTANHPPTLMEFVHEFIDHYVAAEGKLWRSLWGLLAKPGFLTAEYLAGRKTRYVLPLRLLLTLGLVFFIALKLVPSAPAQLGLSPVAPAASAPSGPAADGDTDDAESLSPAALGEKLEKAAKATSVADRSEWVAVGLPASWRPYLPASLVHRVDQANAAFRQEPSAFMRRTGNAILGLAPYAVLCSLPFFAALLKLLFWRQTYGTHFVFAMHLHAAWYGMLLLTLLLPWAGTVFTIWVWSNLYPILALKRVHAAGWGTTLLRALVLAGLHWLVIGVVVLGLAIAGALTAA